MTEINLPQPIQTIATQLNETDPGPLKTIARLVRVVGQERALALLAETLAVEADGGLLTEDGQRRRTPGGVFFKLTKAQLSSRERGRIFGPRPKAAMPKKIVVPPDWPELLPIVTELLANPFPGDANKMKLTLIGKPGKIIEKGEMVLTSLRGGKAPALPKGLPAPPAEPTTYLVFIAAKQWCTVKTALDADPLDRLVIEGYPVLDKRIAGGTVGVPVCPERDHHGLAAGEVRGKQAGAGVITFIRRCILRRRYPTPGE